MWQRINLTNGIDASLIDSSGVNYDFSAYIGGSGTQDDVASVSLTFVNAAENIVGDPVKLGPVFANDRQNITSLIFQGTQGIIPATARALTIFVLMIRTFGAQNNAAIDDISLILTR